MSTEKGPEADEATFIARGVKEPSPLGTTVFVGLRALDPLLQYGILKHGYGQRLLNKIGLETLPAGLATDTGIALIDGLGLSPYRLILLSMAAGSALKHIWWLLAISQEKFQPGTAVTVATFNATVNALNNTLFTLVLTSASLSGAEEFPQTPLLAGLLLYVVGMLTEITSEAQRARFKAKPENKGKPCTTGLWKDARHINYTGYMLWRSGFALASGGWFWGAVVFAFHMYDFSQRAVPELNDYCQQRVSVTWFRRGNCSKLTISFSQYGKAWTAFKEQTPYILIPRML